MCKVFQAKISLSSPHSFFRNSLSIIFVDFVGLFYAYQQMKPLGISNFLIFYTFRRILEILDLPEYLWIKLTISNSFQN